jgi:AraC-like DNA-binding protein
MYVQTRPQKGEGFVGQQVVVLPKWVVANSLRHPLLQDLLLTDIGFFPKAAGHWRERATGADQTILIYCTQGAGWCELSGQRHAVKPGDLLAIPPGVGHAYGAHEKRPWSIFWAHAAGASMKLLLDELGISLGRPLLFVGQDPQLMALFEEAIDVVEQGYTLSHLLYASRTLAHLIGLMIWHRQQKWQSDPGPRQKIAQSIIFMKRHLHQPLKVSQLGAMANLSSSHYSALFKQQTGYAPIDYFIRLRMHKAGKLLDNTDLSVKEVANILGYEDAFYFSRVFKALNDISPTEYRLLHNG